MVDVTLSLVGANGDEIVFTDEGSFVLTAGLSGLGIPATQVRIDDSASDGGVWRFSKRGVRELDLPIVVFGADRAEVEANLRRLSLLLNDRDGGVVLRASYSSGSIWDLTDGHYVAGASGLRGDDGGLAWERWVVSLQFANPFWISEASESFAVGAPTAVGTLIPNLAELVVSSSQAVGSITVENPGDVDAFPVWSLRGPADSVTISNGSESFVYNAPISASSTVVVDSAAGTVVDQAGVNRYGNLGVSPKLFALPAGMSQVSVTATNASAGSWTEVETLATNLVTNPSMEASSGTVTVRTNLATNPSMESVSSGSVVMRRNLSENPRMVTGTYPVANYATVTITKNVAVPAPHPLGITTCAESKNTLADSGVLLSIYGADGRINTGSIQRTLGAWIYVNEAGYQIQGGSGWPSTTLAANTWTWIQQTTAVAAGGWAGLTIVKTTGLTSTTARAYVTGVIAEAGTTVGDFFDGSTTDALGWDYAWSGTANASISTAACAATTVRTNLVTNPSVEVDTTGWTTSGGTIARVTTQAYVGTASLQLTANSYNGALYDVASVTASQTYTSSVWVKGTAGDTALLELTERTSGGTTVGTTSGTVTTLTGSWQRLTVTRTFGSTGVNARLIIRNTSATSSPTYWDALMLEASSTVGDYFDGSFNPAGDFSYAWTGTANASTSIQRGATEASYAPSGVGAVASREWALTGNQSLRVIPTSTSTNDTFVSLEGDTGAFRLGMSAGNTYTVSGTIRLAAAQTGTLNARARRIAFFYKNSAGTYVEAQSTQAPNSAGSTRLSVTVTIPSGATEAFIRLTNGAPVGGGDVWWDNVLLEASPIVQDYFDGSVVSADADLTNSWSGTAHASTSLMRGVGVAGYVLGNSATVQSANWASTGTKSLRIVPNSSSNDTFSYCSISTTVGSTYTVIAKIRLTSPQTGTLLQYARSIGITDSPVTVVLKRSSSAPNQAGVHTVSLTFTATTTTSLVYLLNGASAGNGDVWWDDLIVVAGTYTGNYFDGNSTTLRENSYAWTGTANASTSTWKRREIQGATLISCNYQPRKEVVH